ncbi:MAG TPA: hypothetical protein PKW28_15370 [Turneriella sp.]|nr:hypothetical protein [Turneriella sp.]HNE19015.1 hypothetical protein [Turneriella sp.]HNJ67276.1 hypothetical protein [Turneriella sp.]
MRNLAVARRALLVLVAAAMPELRAERFAGESLEIGIERYQPVAPTANANFTGLVINYYPSRYVYFGTNQMSLYVRGESDYRPDFHLGVIFPFTENFAAEAALGVDFYTALIIALAIADEDSNIDYKFTTNFYSPYFTFSTGLRYEFDAFTLKLMAQTQLGGYLRDETSNFNASVWLGLGVTYRLAL